MSSPMPSPGMSPAPGGFPDVSTRALRLKVLYTFDDDNKTNCLARWPNVINVKTVNIDQSVIGVVELKTCIQAIVSASPELVAKLGQDYTVYAYDYSEYETPLVGQGMLSWALAAASSTPTAPAHQSRQLITGRVCSNLLGFFQSGGQDTLEVKLRLVPVPTCLQSEYINSMEKYKELSKVMPEGFDPAAWKSFLQTNPDFRELASRLGSSTPSVESEQQRTVAGMEMLGQLINQGSQSDDYFEQTSLHDQETSVDNCTQLQQTGLAETFSRTASPALSVNAGMEFHRITHSNQSRPNSRMSMESRIQQEQSLAESSFPTEGLEGGLDVGGEEGPARKRARVVKADWKGKSNLPTPDSLRVVASTAASMRIYRPIAKAPGISQESLEGPPRVPTPIPQGASNAPHRSRPSARSSLRRESFNQHEMSLAGGFQDFEDHRLSESGIASPEETRNRSPSKTPCDIPSSPPVLPDISPAPSSPALPTLPHHDSGFMSGSAEDLFGDEAMRPCDEDSLPTTSVYGKRSNLPQGTTIESDGLIIHHESPGPQELLPSKMLPRRVRGIRKLSSVNTSEGSNANGGQPVPCVKNKNFSKPRPLSRKPSVSDSRLPEAPQTMQTGSVSSSQFQTFPDQRPIRTMTRTPSMGNLKLPAIPASDPVHPGPSSLHRSQTWAGVQHPMSDAPVFTPPVHTNFPEKPLRSGAGAKRKREIQSRLAAAIEQGEIPPYCDNCGAIETPTWRKAWAKVVYGPLGGLRVSEEPGGILAIEIAQRDASGEVIAHRLIKKSLQEDDEEFAELTLCNPCGLWLSKFKCMRPEDKWVKQPKKDQGDKRKRVRNKRATTDGAPTPSESGQTEREASTADQPTPSDAAEGETPRDDIAIGVNESASKKPRASSAEPERLQYQPKSTLDKNAAEAALRRAIQSSPVRLIGTPKKPVDVDVLGTTRRLLFPSPRKEGEQKGLEDALRSGSKETSTTKGRRSSVSPSPSKVASNDSHNKENRPPMDANDDSDLPPVSLEEHLSSTPPPETPTRSSPSASNLFKTPTRDDGSDKAPASIRSGLSSLFSSATKPGNNYHIETPEHTLGFHPTSRTGSPQYTPFTTQLHHMLSEVNVSPSAPNHHSHDFEIPDLDEMLNTRTTPGRAFRLDTFVREGEGVMPSSPPEMGRGFFSLYEDPVGSEGGLWSEFVDGSG